MDYIVWIKDEYGDLWGRADAGDKPAAKRIILEHMKAGREPVLTVEVPFELVLNVGEPGIEDKKTKTPKMPTSLEIPGEEGKGEADKNKAKPD